MRKKVLVLSNSLDATADYLVDRLVSQHVPTIRIDTDKDLQKASFNYDQSEPTLSWRNHRLQPKEVKSLIFRRPKPINLSHIPDEITRRHSSKEWSEALEGFLAHIDFERWINHPSSNFIASHKIEQLSRAQRLGLIIPESLVTNSSKKAFDFFERLGRLAVVKPLATGYIERDAVDTQIYTSVVDENNEEIISTIGHCPVLFQKKIEKTADVRITVLDSKPVAMKLLRTDFTNNQVLDIRRDNMEGVSYEPIETPPEIQNKLSSLLASYRLRFAAVDFVIDTAGNWVFLEINPNGQWAWLDLVGKANIGNLFCEVVA